MKKWILDPIATAEHQAASVWQHWKVRRAVAVIFGVVLPIVCLVLDPAVFKQASWLHLPHGEPALGRFQIFGYGSILIAVVTLLAWFSGALRHSHLLAIAAGVFGLAAALAFGLGLTLLPLSLPGLILLIGALGFLPFFAAVVYTRAANRAWRRARRSLPALSCGAAALCAAFAVFLCAGSMQWAANWITNEAVARITSGPTGESDWPVKFLKLTTSSLGDYQLFTAIGQEMDEQRRARLEAFYHVVTGTNYEDRRSELED